MKDHQILYGDVWVSLTTLRDESIDCVITSPPYWSQRDYGFMGQIGNESNCTDYLAKLITIFNLLRQKLKPKGVFYLNIGDKYLSKYGNTPLGLIPYKLAYYLCRDGWTLSDTIIWYKINYMPSSVKNRFTNTYEPVFVLAKEKANYYTNYKREKNSSNIIKIPLQPVPYKHMATFPEKLVEALLQFGLPNDAVILDPFAGSGTTCKAVQNLSEGYFNPIKMRSIMIEAYKEYIKIMKARCNIPKKNIRKISYQNFRVRALPEALKISPDNTKTLEDFDIKPSNVIIKIFTDTEEFRSFSPALFDNSLSTILDDNGIFFLGLPNHNIDDIFLLTQLNQNGWIIRNVLITVQDNDWIPIFMMVKDIKSVRYKFNLDAIRKTHRYDLPKKWNMVDFVGYKVEKSQAFYKNSNTGLIAKILTTYSDGFPHWIVVKWISGKYSIEEVINSNSKRQIKMYCPKCSTKLSDYHHYKNEIRCPVCSLRLWKGIESIPVLTSVSPRVEPEYHHKEIEVTSKETKKEYEGKFKGVKRINIGQSPGARASINEQYFSVQRYYNVKQSMVCDYLNLHRKKNRLSKNKLTKIFPPEYVHTVGHWLRKDMGGSLPKHEDLMTLKELLHLDDSYIDYISRVGLKLQIVQAEAKGKNPGDFFDLPLTNVVNMLRKLGD